MMGKDPTLFGLQEDVGEASGGSYYEYSVDYGLATVKVGRSERRYFSELVVRLTPEDLDEVRYAPDEMMAVLQRFNYQTFYFAIERFVVDESWRASNAVVHGAMDVHWMFHSRFPSPAIERWTAPLVGTYFSAPEVVQWMDSSAMRPAARQLLQATAPRGELPRPRSPWIHEIGPVFTHQRLADALGVEAEQIDSMTALGRLLTVTTSDGLTFYPASQISRRGGLLPDLDVLLTAWSDDVMDDLTKASLLRRPLAGLENRSIRDVLEDTGHMSEDVHREIVRIRGRHSQ